MIYGPKIGEYVRLHYKPNVRPVALFHSAVGIIEIIGNGPGPRNLGVRIGSHLVVVPRGNVVRRKGEAT